MRQVTGTIIKIAVSGILLVLLVYFGKIDLQLFGQQLQNAQPVFLLLAFLVYIGAICLGAYKWQILLKPLGVHVPLRDLIAYSFVGLFLGNFLPSATVSGDAVRAFNLARQTGRPAEVATSVTIDRLIGMLGFMGMAVVMALVAVFGIRIASLQWLVIPTTVAFTLMAIGFVALLSVGLMRRSGSFIFNLPLLARVRPLARVVYSTLQTYRNNAASLGVAMVIGLVAQLMTVLVNWLVSIALNPQQPPVDLLSILVFNPLIGFVPLVPVAFNGIGPLQAAYVFFYGLVGVAQASAFALGVLMQAIIIGSSLPGGFFLWLHRAVRPDAQSDTDRNLPSET